ncbi:MAG: chemotaxis protein CheA [SAR324 cluster bacterium]|nr:chemotaxis protein CheA [SAR324 cluster bacterium]
MTPDQLPIEEFLEEADELVEDLESSLLELESNLKDRSIIDKIFRAMHTIKGGAGMVMQSELSDYAHHLETLLDQVRSGGVECTSELVSTLLKANDCIISFIQKIRGEGEVDEELKETTLKELKSFSNQSPQPVVEEKKEVPVPQKNAEEVHQTGQQTYLITLKFNEDFLTQGSDPLLVLSQLKELGEISVIPHLSELPDYKVFDPEKLYLWWSIKLTTEQSITDIENVLIFFQEGNQLKIESIDTPDEEQTQVRNAHQQMIQEAESSEVPDKDTEVIEKDGVQEKEEKEEETTQSQATGEEDALSSTTDNSPQPPQKPVEKTEETQVVQSIRVQVDKLDKLQNLVGETVINQARLMRLSEEITAIDENLGEMVLQFVEDNETSVRELQDQIQQVRMIEMGSIFTPMKRIVRDFAVKNQKQINLDIHGADTELDKTVTEQLHGPLVHLIRNAMDHGIEKPDERNNKGKDRTGTITLRASHQEGFVIVEIEDDGKGMDPQKIYEAGVRKGIVAEGEQLSDMEAFQLIFQPGFTTTTEVTSTSGRGVGMDSVKKQIESLLGNIEIQSKVNQGTLVRLKLPLTLAIIEGMIVKVGQQVFTLPLLSVVEALKPLDRQVKHMKRSGELIDIRGEFIPLIRLHKKLQLKDALEDPKEGLVVVVQQSNQKHCLLVDEIIDQRPVVIKNLEDHFIQVPGLAGATIMGDGSISFILDVSSLVNS